MGRVDLKVVIWKIGGGKGDRLVMMVISGGWCVAIEMDGLWLIAMDGGQKWEVCAALLDNGRKVAN